MGEALVIGYGSIGQRHARLLSSMGYNTAVVTKAQIEGLHFPSLEAYLAVVDNPDYIVIANETSKHLQTYALIKQLVKHPTKILIEKPLCHTFADLGNVDPLPHTWVAYNLRFDPLLQEIRQILNGRHLYSAQIYVGQYLPEWRPSQDYRQSYSADRDRGGGVVRDLSHELDYLCWLFGGWTRVVSISGRHSNLEINSDDTCAALLQTALCPAVTLEMNYTDRLTQRRISIVGEGFTLVGDFASRTLRTNSETRHIPIMRDETYIRQHESALSDSPLNCSFADGVAVVKLIEAIEASSKNNVWVAK